MLPSRLRYREFLTYIRRDLSELQIDYPDSLGDMLYGPYVQRPGGGKMQAMLHAILDDASRLIPHAQFYASEGLDVCLDCLRQAVAARGVAVRLYMDNAKIYRSPQLARIAASIGTLIVHTPPYQPEGRGKIERFFRSAREQFLNNLDRKQTLSLEELNERLWAWLDLYHCLDRVVRRDCTLQLHNRFYEAPPHLAGETIEARFDPLDSAVVEIYFQGKPEGTARLVDPVVNAQLPSTKSSKAEPEPTGIHFVDLLIASPRTPRWCSRWPSCSPSSPRNRHPAGSNPDSCRPKASSLSAANPRSARACWWPISRWRWPPAKTAPVSPCPPPAVSSSASSNSRWRSLFPGWRPCAVPSAPPPARICWWTPAPWVIC
jgi:hypothetical protein